MPRCVRWQYNIKAQEVDKAPLRKRELIGLLIRYHSDYYSASDYQDEAAFLQGNTYTFKVQSNLGTIVSIPAKFVNPCMFQVELDHSWNKCDVCLLYNTQHPFI